MNLSNSLRYVHGNQSDYLPLIFRVHDVAASFLIRLHRDEGVTIVAVEIGESHRSINYEGLLPQPLRPLWESSVANMSIRFDRYYKLISVVLLFAYDFIF